MDRDTITCLRECPFYLFQFETETCRAVPSRDGDRPNCYNRIYYGASCKWGFVERDIEDPRESKKETSEVLR